MAEKSVSKEYLLKQLRHLIGKELYEDVTDEIVTTPASCTRIVSPIVLSATSWFKYTGSKSSCVTVATATEATNYTTLCGETIVIGDKVRPALLIDDDNLTTYVDHLSGLTVGNYIKLDQSGGADYDVIMNGVAYDTDKDYINSVFFPDEPQNVGTIIDFTAEETEEVFTELKSMIRNLKEKKLTIKDVTSTQYYKMTLNDEVEHDVLYYLTDAFEPTCYLNSQNIFGGGEGGIDTSTAKDGDFLVYSATARKPVWKEVKDAEGILF